jgi:hypothetical protein
MAGFKGNMGGGMNMQAMMKQAQKLQEQMQKAKEELEDSLFDGTAGGGLVTVTLDGAKKIDSIQIKPEAVDPDDIEMLEDLLIAAFNDAYKQVEEMEKELMPAGMGGFGL